MKRRLVAAWLCCGCLIACDKKGTFRGPAASVPDPVLIQVQLADSLYIAYDGYIQVHPSSKTSAIYALHVDDPPAGMTLEFQMTTNTANTDQSCTFAGFGLRFNRAPPAQWSPVGDPTLFISSVSSGCITAAFTGRAICIAGDTTGVTAPVSINFKNVPVVY